MLYNVAEDFDLTIFLIRFNLIASMRVDRQEFNRLSIVELRVGPPFPPLEARARARVRFVIVLQAATTTTTMRKKRNRPRRSRRAGKRE